MNRFGASLFCHLLFTRRSLDICHCSRERKHSYKRFAKDETASFRKISPDGTQAIYVVRSIEEKKEERRREA